MLFQFAVSPDVTMGDLAYAIYVYVECDSIRRYWIGQAGAEESMWVTISIPDDPFEVYRLMRDAIGAEVFSQVDDLTAVTDFPSRFREHYSDDGLAEVMAMEQSDVAEFDKLFVDCDYNLSYRIANDSNPSTVAEILYGLTKCDIPYWLDVGDDIPEMTLSVHVKNNLDRTTVESAFRYFGISIYEYDSKHEKIEKSIELHKEALERLSEVR